MGCQGMAGADRLNQNDFAREEAEDKHESDEQTASHHKNVF